MTDEKIREVAVGELKPFDSSITLVEYDPLWPEYFAREAWRIKNVLGNRALRVEHVGSTSVPGLIAKPIIDILLVVADSADEPSYVPALEGQVTVSPSGNPTGTSIASSKVLTSTSTCTSSQKGRGRFREL